MIRALDSMRPPTSAQVAQAKAAGYGAWLGYLGKAGDNLAEPWTQADFNTVRSAGLLTGAYCSGQDDPTWVKATAAAWGLHVVILDDEAGIRTDGSWVPGWLATSGAGLYGNGAVMREFANNPAIPFFVLAAYPGTGTQTITWSQAEAGRPAPTKPHGWQWAGTVFMFGTEVDLANFDDAIFAAAPPTKPKEDPVSAYMIRNGAGTIALISDGHFLPINSDADRAALEAAGIGLSNPISDQLWGEINQAYTSPSGGAPTTSAPKASGTASISGQITFS